MPSREGAPLRVTVLVGVAMGVAGLAWLLLRGPGPMAGPVPSHEPVAAVGAPGDGPGAALAVAAAGDDAPAVPALRSPIEPDRPVPVDFRQPTTVSGRCLGHDGTPLPGCTLGVRVLRPTPEIDPHGRTTDADGRFAVQVPHGVALEVSLRAPGCAARVAPIARLDPGTQLDLGDVVMHLGRRVLGTLRDEKGMPRAGVLVRLLREPKVRELQQRTRPQRVLETRTDAGGGLSFADPVTPGQWRVLVSGAGSYKPTKVEIEASGAEFVLDLVAQKFPEATEITGIVRDEAGAPVPRALVVAEASEPDGKRTLIERADTAADGTFVLQNKQKAEARPVRLRVEATGCEYVVDERMREWGTRDVDLRVCRSAAISVRVARREGTPVEGFALHVFRPQPNDIGELRSRSKGQHEGGIAHATGVLPGAQVVLVEPLVPGLVQNGVLRVDHRGGSMRLDVELDQAVRRRLRVVGRDGAPVAHATVELLVQLGSSPPTIDTPAAKLMDLARPHGERALRVVSAFTDSSGAVDLTGHPETGYFLRIKSLRHARYFEPCVLGRWPPVTEVCMPDGARIEGVLQPAAFVAQIAKIAGDALRVGLVRTKDGQTARHEFGVRPDVQGRFVIDHVSPGDWEVEVSWKVGISPLTRLAGGGKVAPETLARWKEQAARRPAVRVAPRDRAPGGVEIFAPPPAPATEPVWPYPDAQENQAVVGSVLALADGETRSVILRVDHLLYATLRGRVVAEGAGDAPQARLVGIEPNVSPVRLPLDENRGFWVYAKPGKYVCEIAVSEGRYMRTDQVLTLQAGVASEATLVARLVQVRFVVVDAAAKPVKGIELRLQPSAEDGGAITMSVSGERGDVLAFVPPARYRLLAGDQKLIDVDLRQAPKGPIQVEIPAGARK